MKWSILNKLLSKWDAGTTIVGGGYSGKRGYVGSLLTCDPFILSGRFEDLIFGPGVLDCHDTIPGSRSFSRGEVVVLSGDTWSSPLINSFPLFTLLWFSTIHISHEPKDPHSFLGWSLDVLSSPLVFIFLYCFFMSWEIFLISFSMLLIRCFNSAGIMSMAFIHSCSDYFILLNSLSLWEH